MNGGPGAASQDHEILSISWRLAEDPVEFEGGPSFDARDYELTDGSRVGPLVWSPRFSSPSGKLLARSGMRLINRTDYYRCKE